MGEKKEEDLYRNFSRKDLQGLCKKYGLPANKSNSEMATSVILYLEKKNISSKNVWEAPGSDPYLSLWSELQPGVRMNSPGDKRADLREISSQNGFGQSRKHQIPDQNGLRSTKGPASSDKASEYMGLLTKPREGSSSGAGDAENAYSSVLSSTTELSLPTFVYDVSSSNGIELYVDLYSDTSDWIESLTAGVNVSRDINNQKSDSYAHKTSRLEDESCPTTKKADVALQGDELGEKRANLSSVPKPAELQNRGPESLIIKENGPGIDSDPGLVPQIRTFNFSGKTTPCDPKHSNVGDGSRNPAFKSSRSSRPPSVGIEASSGVNLSQSQNIATSSSTVATRLVSADRGQNNSAPQFGPFSPAQFCGNVSQMRHGQTIEFSDARHQVGMRPYFPFPGLSWTNVNPDNSIGSISSHLSGQRAVVLPRNDASPTPFDICGPRGLAAPKKSRFDNHIGNYSNNLDGEVFRGQVRSNLGSSKASDVNKRFNMTEPLVKRANSEYNQVQMKRPFSSVDGQRQPESSGGNIVPVLNQFYGDARSSRRRAKRPVTKVIVHDKNGDAHDKP